MRPVFISETQGTQRHGTFDAVLLKSMEQNGKTSTIQSDAKAITKIDGIVIGCLVEGGISNAVLVDYPNNPSGSPLPAVSTVVVGKEDIGKAVALAFETGDPRRPILIGLIHQSQVIHDNTDSATVPSTMESVDVQLDGKRLTLTADQEIILRCGKASITLTRAGKVLIRGAYVLSRSSGVNRIKGGSVQLN
jgi:hypothetical protein